MIDTAIGGSKTRFTNRGQNPSLTVLASSKRSEKSFLETHMKKKLKTDGENTYIVDEPVWNVRPPTEYSGRRFKVALGNKFLASEVISDESLIPDLKNRGYKILDVPAEKKHIPWKELVTEDRENVGPRTLKNFIFPWKE